MRTIHSNIHAARHGAHAGARDHCVRFVLGVGMAGIGAALWLAELARSLAG